MRNAHLHAVLALALAAPWGCARGLERGIRGGVQGGIEGGLEALNDPHNKELLRRLLQDAEILRAAHDLTEALTRGAVDGLTDEQRLARVRQASDDYIRTIARAVGEALNEDVGPAVTRRVEAVVGGAVASALSQGNAGLARHFVDHVTRGAVVAFTRSSAHGLREDLGPALAAVLAEDLGPALGKVIADDVGPALRGVIARELKPLVDAATGGDAQRAAGALTRSLSAQIVLGVNDGLSDLGLSPVPSEKSGWGPLWWVFYGFIALLVILTAVLLRLYFTRRALARERARSDELLVEVLHTISTTDPGSPETQAQLAAVLTRARQRFPGRFGADA